MTDPDHASTDDRRAVLVVEDNEMTRQFLSMALNTAFRVTITKSATEALERIHQGAPLFDVFLLDISLRFGPGGVAILRELREMDAYRYTPAIAITAYEPNAAPEDFMAAGFDGYLRKPFYQAELLELIDKLLASDAG
jgi:two-component system chemotaxis response regulator CheY